MEVPRYTSAEWVNVLYPSGNLKIIDASGWDKKNFKFSFSEEKIAQHEFYDRLFRSEIEYQNQKL